jgi:uncharacterized membrane protein YphA (DoxX/SURF4 family)
MKRTKIIYWTLTIIFALFMAFTAVPDVMLVPDAVKFMQHLGYPNYFTVFIGAAKILGAIAILIPGFPKIKEWAYAGFFFDLTGAIWSVGSTDGISPSITFMLLPIVVGALSYFFWHKLYAVQLKKSS